MANLKEVRERISSVKNTQQITKAMKMVSAAKLRRAQTAIQDMRPYSRKLSRMLANILSNLEGGGETTFGQERKVERACLVVVTSNRGLAGAFNTNIIKAALRAMNGELAGPLAAGTLDVLPIGKKGNDYFRRNYKGQVNILTDHVALFDDLSFDNTREVPKMIMDRFADGAYDKVIVAYSRFRNAAMQFAEVEQFLPVTQVETEEDDDTAGTAHHYRADYIFEPNKEELLKYLIPTILETQFQKYLLDTHASEHGARMTAMDKATDNAQELLRDLKISYNKARQEAITNEILEIVGGAAALEG